MSRSSNLYDLQLVDSQLDQNRNRLKEIAALLSEDTAVQKTEAKFKEAEGVYKRTEKELRAAELKVKDQRLKIKQTDRKLYGGAIRNPKELQNLQDENDALKRFLSVLEDRQLECMLELDDVKEQQSNALKNLNNARKKKENLDQKLISERSKIEVDNQKLEPLRHSITQALPKDDLAIYERLRKQRFGLAVSKVNDQACSACGTTLTAALHQTARSPSQIANCESCGRILFAI